MSFWDTVLGHELAETLIRTLPEIAKQNKNSNLQSEELLNSLNCLNKKLDELKELLDLKL